MPDRSTKYDVPDAENPEWTSEKFRRAKRAVDILELQWLLKRSHRPATVAAKKLVRIRLSVDVVDALRATGSGWQSRADEALRSYLKRQAESKS